MADDVFDQVTLAIDAHREWTQRLPTVIRTGRSVLNPAEVNADNRCEFGRWLHSLPPASKATANWRDVQRLHTCFHQETSAVLALALRGDKADAARRLGLGGPFASASAALTAAMRRWKTSQAA